MFEDLQLSLASRNNGFGSRFPEFGLKSGFNNFYVKKKHQNKALQISKSGC